ncbi:MAG: ABC transporter substrate binding protein [Desulfobacterales bacterium]
MAQKGFKHKLAATFSSGVEENTCLIRNLPNMIMVCLTFSLITTSVAGQEAKRVYIAPSYEKNHICGGPQEEGVIKGLNKTGWFEGMNLEVKRYYMDTKRKNTTPEAMKNEANIIFKQINEFKPEVLVVVDDNAFREVALPLADEKDLAVVFSGMNGQPESYNAKKRFMNNRARPGGNITGVYEKLYLVRSMMVMQSAIPDLKGKKIVGITDYSPTGNALAAQFEIELKNKPKTIDWEHKRVKNWKEYTSLIKKLNDDKKTRALYPMALSLKVSDTVTYTAPEIFKWTVANSHKPEMALNYFFAKIGLFGGAAVDFKAMGLLAGKKAGQILNGEKAGNLSIEDAPDYAIVFNLKRAKELGIEIPHPLLTAADHVYK